MTRTATVSGVLFLVFTAAAGYHGLDVSRNPGERMPITGAGVAGWAMTTDRVPGEPGSGVMRVGPLALDPSMNPMRVAVRGSFRGSAGPRHYELVLADDAGNTAFTRKEELKPADGGGGLLTVDIMEPAFRVPRAGAYTFDLTLHLLDSDELQTAGIELNRNARELNPLLFWGSLAVALLCLLVYLGSRNSGETAAAASRRAA
jgi:hypothetical protein